MIEARKAGVRTPVIYDIDVKECNITREFIAGRKVKEILDDEPSVSKELCSRIGKIVAMLHNARISHGDLTTSNMILMPNGDICIFDLSLGTTLAEIEDLGVDVHLLQRAFTSAHSGMDDELNILMDSYSKSMKDYDIILKRVEDIKGRGRYTCS
jgi:TP53 regulating kinase-like protein/N6-L-threonylcarbamoyladenine synthase/protein kinase Bud32